MPTFRLEFDMGNAAFDEAPHIEIMRILRAVGGAVSVNSEEGGPPPMGVSHMIRDVNGNRVGRWWIEP